MAITAATTLSGFSGFLNPEQSEAVFNKARKTSIVQQLARKIPLGISGQAIPYTATKPVAGWVAEAGTKPATSGSMSLETMTPKKLAAILVVSAEVVRANPGGFMQEMRDDLAEAFAVAFDAAALHGTSTPFTHYIDETTKTVELGTAAASAGGIYADINAGLKLLVDDGKELTGFALDSRSEPVLNASVDGNGRPLFIDSPYTETNPTVRPGRLLGRPAYIGKTVYGAGDSTVAYGGDWSQAAWGVVGGITYDVSTEAPVTINGSLVSMWEKNLVGVRAEAEYGFVVHDTAAFVQYTNAS